jgi:hypothetical protein
MPEKKAPLSFRRLRREKMILDIMLKRVLTKTSARQALSTLQK